MILVVPCRHCGGDNTHHVAVDIHERAAEDGVTSSKRVSGMLSPSTQNPSPRRNGITVLLWCEACHGITELMIYQHRGQTIIETAPGDTETGYWN